MTCTWDVQKRQRPQQIQNVMHTTTPLVVARKHLKPAAGTAHTHSLHMSLVSTVGPC